MCTITNNLTPDFLIVSDVNRTVTIVDSIKDEDSNVFLSQITEGIRGQFDADAPCQSNIEAPVRSYKELVQKVLVPGDKRNEVIKKMQNRKINNFLRDLDSSCSPLYRHVSKLYKDLKKNYWDKETKSVKVDIFPSFFNLVNAVNLIGRCSIMLPTFGEDGETIAEYLMKSKFIRLKFGEIHFAKMAQGGGASI